MKRWIVILVLVLLLLDAAWFVSVLRRAKTPSGPVVATIDYDISRDETGARVVFLQLSYNTARQPEVQGEPSFEVVNDKGEQVYSGKFQFG